MSQSTKEKGRNCNEEKLKGFQRKGDTKYIRIQRHIFTRKTLNSPAKFRNLDAKLFLLSRMSRNQIPIQLIHSISEHNIHTTQTQKHTLFMYVESIRLIGNTQNEIYSVSTTMKTEIKIHTYKQDLPI